jgi:ribosomal protein L44E
MPMRVVNMSKKKDLTLHCSECLNANRYKDKRLKTLKENARPLGDWYDAAESEGTS